MIELWLTPPAMTDAEFMESLPFVLWGLFWLFLSLIIIALTERKRK
jgi:hypothetical protein